MIDRKIRGTLRSYLRWPLLLCPFLVIMNIHIYTLNLTAGYFISGYIFVYILISFVIFRFNRASLLKDLIQYSIRFNATNEHILNELDLPMTILDSEGNFLWANREFHNLFSDSKRKASHISTIIPAISSSSLPNDDSTEVKLHFTSESHYYKAILQKVDFTQIETVGKNHLGIGNSAIFLYIHDETEVVSYIKENREQRLSVGLLYIDNYDESIENVEDVRQSLVTALIDRKINKYMLEIDAITKKLEKDKYIFLFQHKYLSELQNDRFSLLDEIRSINVGGDVSVTISIGVGVEAESYKKRQEYARTAIDLALGRGGDQVVVKTPDNILYYGGKSMQLEKNTRVKARVKAHALRESMVAAGHIVIMGHRLPDVDSLGSAIGVYRIAKTLGKPVHIVVNEVSSSLKPLLQLFQNNPDYEEDLFVTADEAVAYVNSSTLLVIVDVNRPSYCDAPNLIDRTNTIVILDHHRQTGEFFENPVLSYVEPFASSACEMVAEILQYVGEEVRIKPFEADALYAGIMVDTNNFMNKPGVRTFEAVAYLRRQGADITRIRKMFRTDMAEYKIRAEAIQNTEIFMDNYALAFCNADGMESPTIVGAKISDELLNIIGIKASFVLTAWGDKIYISARSIDELNVQIIMERLGGGGHAACAGAQLPDYTMEDATALLRETLKKMKEEGDL